MIRLSVLPLLVIAVLLVFSSCEDYYGDYECPCPHGGVIDDWSEPEDTASINQKDTTGGFEVILEDWNNRETHDISL